MDVSLTRTISYICKGRNPEILMKIFVDTRHDLHPVAQLILHLLMREQFEYVAEHFSISMYKYMKELKDEGYILNEEVPFTSLSEVILSRVKLKKLFGELDSCEGWIDEYRELFMTKKSGTGGSRGACIKKMNRFLASTDYSRDDIMHAARRYINTQRPMYGFLQQADYFIYKNEVSGGISVENSRLETFCEEVVKLSGGILNDDPWNQDSI